jgi:serine/threonine-protein kinase HipA
MSRNNLINVHCFGREIGKLGFDENRNASFFQYNPSFLAEGIYERIFPMIIRRIPETQVFNKFSNETFHGLPPIIADSLPDVFGNIVFKAWLEATQTEFKKISPLEQLTYVGKRGMGALEYLPNKEIKGEVTINIDEITAIVEKVLQNKEHTSQERLDHQALLNIFKIGTSAGGIRPKILVSEHKETGAIIPGDLVYSNDYNHYLVKLGIDEHLSYSREVIEYIYATMAAKAGISMMPAKLIDNKHFATLRFDRQNGEKIHGLTATGLTGWNHRDPSVSSYENLFDLANFLKVPHRDVEQLFRRMVFNLVFANHDDHLKNHSFLYDPAKDSWQLAPAYDITYSLNPEINFTSTSRALSINNKRTEIGLADILTIAEKYTVKNARGIIHDIVEVTGNFQQLGKEWQVPEKVISSIMRDFVTYS